MHHQIIQKAIDNIFSEIFEENAFWVKSFFIPKAKDL